MKKLFKRFIFTVIVFYVLINYYPGLSGSNQWQNLLAAGGIWLILEIAIKPILKLLLIPINILTLGLAGSFINVILLYLLVLLIPSIHIVPFDIGPLNWNGYLIPHYHLGYWLSLIATSVLIGLINSLLWLIFS